MMAVRKKTIIKDLGGSSMEVSYGKEPFDLRLMLLCLGRNLWKILAVTVAGMVLFGGGYYVKNVLLQPISGMRLLPLIR